MSGWIFQMVRDSVLWNMTASIKCATRGVRPNKDLELFQFSPLITVLYSHELNPNSTYLHRFHSLITSIADIGCTPTTPHAEKKQRISSLEPHCQAHVDKSKDFMDTTSLLNSMPRSKLTTPVLFHISQASYLITSRSHCLA